MNRYEAVSAQTLAIVNPSCDLVSVSMPSPLEPVSKVCSFSIIKSAGKCVRYPRMSVFFILLNGLKADVGLFCVSVQPRRSQTSSRTSTPSSVCLVVLKILFLLVLLLVHVMVSVVWRFDQKQKLGVVLCAEDRLAYITQDYTHRQGYTQRSIASAACRKWLMLRPPLN